MGSIREMTSRIDRLLFVERVDNARPKAMGPGQALPLEPFADSWRLKDTIESLCSEDPDGSQPTCGETCGNRKPA